MRYVDETRGYEREMCFHPENLYHTGGGIELTNCVVEAKENDWQGRAPVLSLRFYHKPYPNPPVAYDDKTPIGIEVTLGVEMAQSLIEQINEKWPDLLTFIHQQSDNESPE